MLEPMDSEAEKPSQPAPTSQPLGPDQPDFNRPLKRIAELVTDPEFPRSALGEFVDIGGYTGVIVDIVNQSVKVRSQEGVTKSFNAHGLRRIYGPVIHLPEPPIEFSAPPPPATPGPRPIPRPPPPESPPPPPKPPLIEPDFTRPIKPIAEYVGRPDYPQCVLGEH